MLPSFSQLSLRREVAPTGMVWLTQSAYLDDMRGRVDQAIGRYMEHAHSAVDTHNLAPVSDQRLRQLVTTIADPLARPNPQRGGQDVKEALMLLEHVFTRWATFQLTPNEERRSMRFVRRLFQGLLVFEHIVDLIALLRPQPAGVQVAAVSLLHVMCKHDPPTSWRLPKYNSGVAIRRLMLLLAVEAPAELASYAIKVLRLLVEPEYSYEKHSQRRPDDTETHSSDEPHVQPMKDTCRFMLLQPGLIPALVGLVRSDPNEEQRIPGELMGRVGNSMTILFRLLDFTAGRPWQRIHESGVVRDAIDAAALFAPNLQKQLTDQACCDFLVAFFEKTGHESRKGVVEYLLQHDAVKKMASSLVISLGQMRKQIVDHVRVLDAMASVGQEGLLDFETLRPPPPSPMSAQLFAVKTDTFPDGGVVQFAMTQLMQWNTLIPTDPNANTVLHLLHHGLRGNSDAMAFALEMGFTEWFRRHIAGPVVQLPDFRRIGWGHWFLLTADSFMYDARSRDYIVDASTDADLDRMLNTFAPIFYAYPGAGNILDGTYASSMREMMHHGRVYDLVTESFTALKRLSGPVRPEVVDQDGNVAPAAADVYRRKYDVQLTPRGVEYKNWHWEGIAAYLGDFKICAAAALHNTWPSFWAALMFALQVKDYTKEDYMYAHLYGHEEGDKSLEEMEALRERVKYLESDMEPLAPADLTFLQDAQKEEEKYAAKLKRIDEFQWTEEMDTLYQQRMGWLEVLDKIQLTHKSNLAWEKQLEQALYDARAALENPIKGNILYEVQIRLNHMEVGTRRPKTLRVLTPPTQSVLEQFVRLNQARMGV